MVARYFSVEMGFRSCFRNILLLILITVVRLANYMYMYIDETDICMTLLGFTIKRDNVFWLVYFVVVLYGIDNTFSVRKVWRLRKVLKKTPQTHDIFEISADIARLNRLLPKGRTKIFVREAYIPILAQLEEKWRGETNPDRPEQGIVLIGSPGIGKSTFGGIALLRALAKGYKVLVDTNSYVDIFDGCTHKTTKDTRLGDLSDFVLIRDNVKTPVEQKWGEQIFRFILDIKSPNLFEDFQVTKSGLTPVLMEPYSFDELSLAAQCCETPDLITRALNNCQYAGGNYRLCRKKDCRSQIRFGITKMLGFTQTQEAGISFQTTQKYSHRVLPPCDSRGAGDIGTASC